MGTGEFYFDFAAIMFTAFCGAFVYLVLYLHKEGKREGFPIRHDGVVDNYSDGVGGLPDPKTYKLAHGQGERTVPGPMPEQYELKVSALRRTQSDLNTPILPLTVSRELFRCVLMLTTRYMATIPIQEGRRYLVATAKKVPRLLTFGLIEPSHIFVMRN
jgi:hypothetical protein